MKNALGHMVGVYSWVKRLLVLGVLGQLWSCVEPLSSPSIPRIYGGLPVEEGQWSPALAVVTRGHPEDTWRLLCTGTLLAPQVVLTAGHCVDGLTPQGGDAQSIRSLKKHMGSDLNIGTPSLLLGVSSGVGQEGGLYKGDVIPVQTVRTYPFFRQHPLGIGDIGLLFLERRLDSLPVAQIPFSLEEKLATEKQARTFLVGYGLREDGGQGRKYAVETLVRRLTALEAIAGGAGEDACYGDSGGPGFVVSSDGRLTLFGVVARGMRFECGEGSILTITSQVSCWIGKTAQDVLGIDGFWFPQGLCPEPSTTVYTPRDLAELQSSHFQALCEGLAGTSRQILNARRIALFLAQGQCADAAALLKHTSKVDLAGAMLDDISPLVFFENIEHLEITGNFIQDATPLAVMKWLREVHLPGNNIPDPAAWQPILANGTRIFGKRRQLGNFSHTVFRDYCEKVLEGAPLDPGVRRTVQAILWKLVSEDCTVANQRLLSLRSLSLANRGITDLSPIEGLEHIESLDLSENPIKDVAPLRGLESLRELNLWGTQVEDIGPIQLLIGEGLKVRLPN